MRVSVLDQTKRCCPPGLDHGTVDRCNYCKAFIAKLHASSTVQVAFAWYFVENIFSKRCAFWSAKEYRRIFPQYIQNVNGRFVQCRWSESLWQKRLLCSVTVAKRSFHCDTPFCLNNEPHMNRSVTSLGHQGWQRVLWEGPKFVKFCPIILKYRYVRHIFPGGQNFSKGASPPCTPYLQDCIPTVVHGHPQLYLKCRLPNRISFDVFNQCFFKVKTRAYETLRSCAMRLRVTTLSGASRSFNPALSVAYHSNLFFRSHFSACVWLLTTFKNKLQIVIFKTCSQHLSHTHRHSNEKDQQFRWSVVRFFTCLFMSALTWC